MSQPLTTRISEYQLQLGDRHINYAEGPMTTVPPLLLIHGISGRWQDWSRVFDGFAADWHVFAIDLRGHGKSSWGAGWLSLAVLCP